MKLKEGMLEFFFMKDSILKLLLTKFTYIQSSITVEVLIKKFKTMYFA